MVDPADAWKLVIRNAAELHRVMHDFKRIELVDQVFRRPEIENNIEVISLRLRQALDVEIENLRSRRWAYVISEIFHIDEIKQLGNEGGSFTGSRRRKIGDPLGLVRDPGLVFNSPELLDKAPDRFRRCIVQILRADIENSGAALDQALLGQILEQRHAHSHRASPVQFQAELKRAACPSSTSRGAGGSLL